MRVDATKAKTAIVNGVTITDNFLVVTVNVPPNATSVRVFADAKGGMHGSIDDGRPGDFFGKLIADANNVIDDFKKIFAPQAEDPYEWRPATRSAHLFVWVNDVPVVFKKKQDFDFENYHLQCDEQIPVPPSGTLLELRALHINKSAIQTGFEAHIEIS